MMKLYRFVFFTFFLYNFLYIDTMKCSAQLNSDDIESINRLYHQAQTYFYNKQYDQALTAFNKYIHESKNLETDQPRILWCIDQIGRIYLREKRDPEAAIQFFNDMLKDHRLTEAEEDDISSWIAAAEDWQSVGKFPKMTQDPTEQFELGAMYFKAGMRKLQAPMDKAGNADFAIAQSYLLPFIINNDHDKRIGEALYMMGEIRRRLWNDVTFWAENYYFTEVIRRFPHTPLAWKAYQSFEEDVHFGYSGSGGDFTPESVVKMLKAYKALAMQK
ncbi:MAG: tetratricopeptide repeat protein [bacterium]|nr:MAG: tetratricopeptide repeat protein [bacterium]